MGQIEDLRLFIDVVSNASLTRAAATLKIAKSAVSRRLRLLEDRYGTQLIDRRPGVWEVTAAGHELYQRAVRLLTEADEIDADFTDARLSPAGPLSVSAPRAFGLAFLMPALLRFRADHPQILLTVDFDDRRVDLAHENYDLAIRIAEVPDPTLVTHTLGQAQHRLYASPGYAGSAGLPDTLAALALHPLLHFGPARRASWVFETATGPQQITFQPALNSNSGDFLLAATIAGHGIARLPDFVAAQAQTAGTVIAVLPDLRVASRQVQLVHAENRLVNRRMRAFIDAMSAAFGSMSPP